MIKSGKNIKGVSLIVLVITIIVMVILTGVIVLNILKNNPISKANEAVAASESKSLSDAWKSAYNLLQSSDDDITDSDMVKAMGNTPIPAGYAITAYGVKYTGNDPIKILQALKQGVAATYYNVNVPKLSDTGMTPISFDASGNTVILETNQISSWFDYTNKKWANAKTADGSMWVWIPRFAYKITSGYHTNTSTPSIDVKFLIGDSNLAYDGTVCSESGNSSNTYVVSPSFTFGDKQLTGMWVSKFEASSNQPGNSYGGGMTTSLYVRSVPSVSAWTAINVDYISIVSRNMETNSYYGWGTTGKNIDTHMIKNSEWGAVAYLTTSQYGQKHSLPDSDTKANEVSLNKYTGSNITGYGESTSYSYTTTEGQRASTTGNVYGVYDMAGGVPEYVAAYLSTPNSNTWSGNSLVNSIASKYKDIYTVKGDSYMWYDYYYEWYDMYFDYYEPYYEWYDFAWYDNNGNFIGTSPNYPDVPYGYWDGTLGYVNCATVGSGTWSVMPQTYKDNGNCNYCYDQMMGSVNSYEGMPQLYRDMGWFYNYSNYAGSGLFEDMPQSYKDTYSYYECGQQTVGSGTWAQMPQKYKDNNWYYDNAPEDQLSVYNTSSSVIGDAIWETSSSGIYGTNSWYNDGSSSITASMPFFERGGSGLDGISAGLFSFKSAYGDGISDRGFRTVICVEPGL